MRYKYDLNLELYEVLVKLGNSWRWQGLKNLKNIIDENQERLESTRYSYLIYAISLLIDGRSPSMLTFLLNEEIERVREVEDLDYNISRDLRLIKQVINWMSSMEILSIHELINCIQDEEIRTKYRDWCELNQYQINLDFEQCNKLTIEQRLKIMKSNNIVYKFYLGK